LESIAVPFFSQFAVRWLFARAPLQVLCLTGDKLLEGAGVSASALREFLED